jgi:Flp pilus assembly protein TadG
MKSRRQGESGSVTTIVALCLVVLIGLVALVVDTGYVMNIRNELQNAADGAALAGARSLYLSSLQAGEPNWIAAQEAAVDVVRSNQSSNRPLLDAQVQVGYWNLISKVLQPTSIANTVNDLPAVMVTVSRVSGSNGGPVALVFAPVLGIDTLPVDAQAMAVIGYPKEVDVGQAFPMAILKALADEYWDKYPGQTFRIGSSYHYPTSEAGQWTSFKVDANDVPTIRDLIANGNPEALVADQDQIWIEPGTKTALYSEVANLVGHTVLLPVVEDLSTHGLVTVKGFVPFYIEAAVGGSGKYIQGYFDPNYLVPKSSPGGPQYGALTPPRLVQ